MPHCRKPSGSSSYSHCRRNDKEEDEVSSHDNASDSEDQAQEAHDEEGFVNDEDEPVICLPMVVPVQPPVKYQQEEGTGRMIKRNKEERRLLLPWQEWEDANERWLRKHTMVHGYRVDQEMEAAVVGTMPTVDPAPEVLLPLLQFQKEWLAWALEREASASRGGILADEMGMGKTIQAISLVLTARGLRPPGQQVSSSSSAAPSCPMRRVGCTLVVCPVVAIIHWAQEIERHTAKNSVRHLIY